MNEFMDEGGYEDDMRSPCHAAISIPFIRHDCAGLASCLRVY